MSNIRVIYNNAADRATLSASSTAGALVAANLLTDLKSVVWRGTGTTESITATWTTAELVQGVILPFTNLSSASTIRIRFYTNAADSTPIYDSGTIPAVPGPLLGLWGWGTLLLGANAYSYGGSSYARAWADTPYAVKKVVIDLVDSSNPSGYVEAGRLVIGNIWESSKNPDYGISVTPVDTSKHSRSGAGDLMTDLGTRHNRMALPMSNLSPDDRTSLWNILRVNGQSRPIFVSVFPGDEDSDLEQMHQLYGKLVTSPAMSMPHFRIAAATLEIEEI